MEVWEVSRDLSLLRPAFRGLVEGLLGVLHSEGLQFEVFEAFRSHERQQYLWTCGRTRPGHVVTMAKPYHSFHEFGAAVDIVRREGGKWSWDAGGSRAAEWARMREAAVATGCVVLDWELPHVQEGDVSMEQLLRWSGKGVR